MAGGVRGGVRSGGGLRSSGRSSPPPCFFGRKSMSNTSANLSTGQQQEELVKTYPGVAHIATPPPPDTVAPDDNYPFARCQSYLNYFYDATRLCGSDCLYSVVYREYLREDCGIEVSPDELEKKGSTSTDAAAHP